MKKYILGFLTFLLMLCLSAKSQTNSSDIFNIKTYPYLSVSDEGIRNNSGSNLNPPGFSKKVYTLKNSTRDYQNILVLEEGLDGSMIYHYDNAIGQLGLPRTLVTTWSEFNTAFFGNSWDLVIINSYSYGVPSDVLDGLNNFVSNGGKLIFASWDVGYYSSHALLANVGVSFVSDFTTPQNFYCYNCSHQTFNTPNQVFNFYWTDDQYDVDGQIVEALPDATLIALSEYSYSGHVVLSSTGNCIFNAFQSVNFNGDEDYDGKYDIQELIENEINLLIDSNPCLSAIDYGYVNSPDVYGYLPGSYSEVWYKFYAYDEQNISVSLCGSNYDTWLEVYDECWQPYLAENDDYNCLTKQPVEGKDGRSLQSQLDFSHLQEGWYYIKIRGFGDDYGNFVLSVHTSYDLCINANNYGVVGSAQINGYTSHDFGVEWYSFNVPYDMTDVSVSLCGSDYDTYLAVYDACGGSLLGMDDDYDCETKQPVEGKDGRSLQSQLDFPTLEAGTYYVKVYGYSSHYGNYMLNIFLPNNLPSPTNLIATLDQETGEVFLYWDYQSVDYISEDFEDGVVDNWAPVNGNWSVAGGSYSGQLAGTEAISSYFNANFSDFHLAVSVRNNITDGNVGIYFNGDPTILTSTGAWANTYQLVYYQSGNWNLITKINGESIIIADQISADLNLEPGEWNILEVNFSQGYIDISFNFIYQGSYYDNTYSTGKVGLRSWQGSPDFGAVLLTPLSDGYVFGKVNQNPVRNVYSGEGSNCKDCNENMTLIGTVEAPVPPYGTKYTYQTDKNRSFQYFNIYRNGSLLNTAPESVYFDELPGYGTYEYMVTAQHAEGESNPAGPVTVIWEGTPDISVTPALIEEELESEQTSTKELTIYNEGVGILYYSINISCDYFERNIQKPENQFPESNADLGKFINGFEITEEYILRSSFGNQTTESPKSFGDVIHQIPTPNAASGLTYDGIYLWMVSEQAALAYQIDPDDGNVIRTIPLQSSDAYGIAWDGHYLWHSDYGLDEIFKIDPANGDILFSFSFNDILGLTWDGNYLWGSNPLTDRIYQIDITTGLEINSFASPANHGIGLTYDGDCLWASDYSSSTFYKLSAIDGTVLNSFNGFEEGYKGLAFDGQYIWACGKSNSFIYQFDIDFQGGCDWLTTSTFIGNIPPGSSKTIQFTLDATDLTPDIYTANLNISSNDPDEPLVTIPVTLTVTESGSTTDQLTLHPGWNLISLDVIPNPANPETVFASLISANNLEIITGFQNQMGVFFDPAGLPFLNTLTGLVPGEGYWVKVTNEATLSVTGEAISPTFGINLKTGWILVAYWPAETTTPEAAFADLITASKLLLVTGYEQGGKFYDPNGLPFLNTLTEIKNGFGYWVKVSEDYNGFGY